MGNVCSGEQEEPRPPRATTQKIVAEASSTPWLARVLRETPVKALIPREEKIEETNHTEGCAVAFEKMLRARPPVYATPVWDEESLSYAGKILTNIESLCAQTEGLIIIGFAQAGLTYLIWCRTQWNSSAPERRKSPSRAW